MARKSAASSVALKKETAIGINCSKPPNKALSYKGSASLTSHTSSPLLYSRSPSTSHTSSHVVHSPLSTRHPPTPPKRTTSLISSRLLYEGKAESTGDNISTQCHPEFTHEQRSSQCRKEFPRNHHSSQQFTNDRHSNQRRQESTADRHSNQRHQESTANRHSSQRHQEFTSDRHPNQHHQEFTSDRHPNQHHQEFTSNRHPNQRHKVFTGDHHSNPHHQEFTGDHHSNPHHLEFTSDPSSQHHGEFTGDYHKEASTLAMESQRAFHEPGISPHQNLPATSTAAKPNGLNSFTEATPTSESEGHRSEALSRQHRILRDQLMQVTGEYRRQRANQSRAGGEEEEGGRESRGTDLSTATPSFTTFKPSQPHPIASSTLINPSLSGSSSSHSSTMPTLREQASHHGNGGGWEGERADLKLERALSKIRQQEREVAILEQHLSDKTAAAQIHVSELSRLRNALGAERERAAVARHGLVEEGEVEVAHVRALFERQNLELRRQADEATCTRDEVDREVGRLRGALIASQAEASSALERVSSLTRQLQQETESHSQAMKLLREEASEGSQRVALLEQALQGCRVQLASYATQVEVAAQEKRAEMDTLRTQIATFTTDLSRANHQLTVKTTQCNALETKIAETEIRLRCAEDKMLKAEEKNWKKESQLTEALKASEEERKSLLDQAEQARREVADFSSRLARQEEVVVSARGLHTTVAQLQQSLDNLSSERDRLFEERERLAREGKRLREEGEKTVKELCSVRKEMTDMERVVAEEKEKAALAKELREQIESKFEGLRNEVGSVETELKSQRDEAIRDRDKLTAEVKRLEADVKSLRTSLATADMHVKDRDTMEAAMSHMQQELAKRAKQVMEMDKLLRNHQAATTEKRLNLERALAQRQGDLRGRTKEVEQLTLKYNQSIKSVEGLQQIVLNLRSGMADIHCENSSKRSAQAQEFASMQMRLRDSETGCRLKEKEIDRLRRDTEKWREIGKKWEQKSNDLERQMQQMQREVETTRSRHLAQVQRLEVLHTTAVAANKQQAAGHHMQLTQHAERDRIRLEEVARYQTQVAGLSTELAAQRRAVVESQQLAVIARSETIVSQAHMSSRLSPPEAPSHSPSPNPATLSPQPSSTTTATQSHLSTSPTHTPTPTLPSLITLSSPEVATGDSFVSQETTPGNLTGSGDSLVAKDTVSDHPVSFAEGVAPLTLPTIHPPVGVAGSVTSSHTNTSTSHSWT